MSEMKTVVERVFLASVAVLASVLFYEIPMWSERLTTDWIWIVSWMRYLPAGARPVVVWGIIFLCSFAAAFAAWRWPHLPAPRRRVVAGAAAIAFAMLVALYNSFGRVSHDAFTTMIALGWIASAMPYGLRGAQAGILSTYFLSGLWKLRIYFIQLIDLGFDGLHPAASALAWVKLETGGMREFPLWALSLVESHIFSHAAWWALLAFECGALVVFLAQRNPEFKKVTAILGIAVVLFHFVSDSVLGLEFEEASLTAILVLSLPFVLTLLPRPKTL